MEIAGVPFDDPSQIASAVRKQLGGGIVWSSREDSDHVSGIVRAVHEAGPWRAAFGEAVSALLEDPDPQLRTGAVFLLQVVEEDVGAERLENLLEARPALYRGVQPVRHKLDGTLEEALLQALGRVAERGDARAARLLRQGLLEGHHVYGYVARLDPDWLVAHAAERVPRRVLGAVLRFLPDAVHREAFVRALAPWPASEREAVVHHLLWSALPLPDDEKDRLKAIIAGG